MARYSIDVSGMTSFLLGLLNIYSPTGDTERAIAYVRKAFESLRLDVKLNAKGSLVATLNGQSADRPRALAVHVDTLGAMVKEIKPGGRLKLTMIGGYAWNAVEGEGCHVITASGRRVRGSILHVNASTHVHGKAMTDSPRSEDTMEVRLDERTTSAEETRALGIEIGDFVALDPRVEITNGFIRSRHLDDKACVACIVAAVKALADAGLRPHQTTWLHISNYEEVGHGAAAGIPAEVTELVAVDMAAVGTGQTSDEFHASICVKDSGGPYHHGLSSRLRQLAAQYEIPFVVDIYPFYGSDGEAFWRAGGDVAVALIGPGVDASHNYERTHTEALLATTRWILAYLLN